MPLLSPMTELEAVNEMLMSIGQAPVNTLNVTGIRDVSLARQRLSSMTRRVLTRGFNFNTDEDYELSPDVDGIIPIPTGVIRIEGAEPRQSFTQRRHSSGVLALYNLTDKTFTFPAPVSVKVVWAYSFEDLPETARCYIATAAARRFQSKVIGSQILDRYEEEDEMKAWFLLERDERAQRRTNLFQDNATISAFGNRAH
jgi:hypothetical protein